MVLAPAVACLCMLGMLCSFKPARGGAEPGACPASWLASASSSSKTSSAQQQDSAQILVIKQILFCSATQQGAVLRQAILAGPSTVSGLANAEPQKGKFCFLYALFSNCRSCFTSCFLVCMYTASMTCSQYSMLSACSIGLPECAGGTLCMQLCAVQQRP